MVEIRDHCTFVVYTNIDSLAGIELPSSVHRTPCLQWFSSLVF